MQAWPGVQAASLPKYLSFPIYKENRKEKEKKEKVGMETGHGDNFTGLAKMILIQEKYKWECTKFGLELV